MCFLQRPYEVHKADQTDAAHSVFAHRDESNLFPEEMVYEPTKHLFC